MLPVWIANYIFDRFLQWAQTNFVFQYFEQLHEHCLHEHARKHQFRVGDSQIYISFNAHNGGCACSFPSCTSSCTLDKVLKCFRQDNRCCT